MQPKLFHDIGNHSTQCDDRLWIFSFSQRESIGLGKGLQKVRVLGCVGVKCLGG
jgi:hypothetical protein